MLFFRVISREFWCMVVSIISSIGSPFLNEQIFVVVPLLPVGTLFFLPVESDMVGKEPSGLSLFQCARVVRVPCRLLMVKLQLSISKCHFF